MVRRQLVLFSDFPKSQEKDNKIVFYNYSCGEIENKLIEQRYKIRVDLFAIKKYSSSKITLQLVARPIYCFKINSTRYIY